ncbi:nucleotidyltransferase family protein [Fimbriiglobus ruber]|uniref:Uncharacterized protein n=1 Tax=Fimbriiglobus ruber TaxID=1908690 RepID=A0A225D382_9BACT|nr:nucleotidyltransferase family protein [Fimbriiglobus ruber]OWK36050.1 hypothetical protein FRUB_08613 [Fimbriiglobus ruber]
MDTKPPDTWVLDRMVLAVERVRERLLRVTSALDGAGIPYAVVGGNAVGAWVARVDVAAVRNTQDVDILIRRTDLPVTIQVLEAEGFVYRHVASVDMFLDGPDAKPRDAVHVAFSNEKVRDDYLLPTPDVAEYEIAPPFRVLPLEALVRMKLTSFRRKDQVHIQDLIDVGLVDQSWLGRVPPELADRLREILANPDG